MGQLVGDHRLQHCQRHLGRPGRRNQHERPHQAHRHRLAHPPAEEHQRPGPHPQPAAELLDALGQFARSAAAAAAESRDADHARSSRQPKNATPASHAASTYG